MRNFAKEKSYPLSLDDRVLIILNEFRPFGDSSYIKIPENI